MSYDNILCSLKGGEYQRFIAFASAVSDKYGYDIAGDNAVHIVVELDATALEYLRSMESVLDICGYNGGIEDLCFYDVEMWCSVDTKGERADVDPDYWKVFVEKFASDGLRGLLTHPYMGETIKGIEGSDRSIDIRLGSGKRLVFTRATVKTTENAAGAVISQVVFRDDGGAVRAEIVTDRGAFSFVAEKVELTD